MIISRMGVFKVELALRQLFLKLMYPQSKHVAAETCFALKGGTAINLFVRDMPRLSVDIDLTYAGGESWTVPGP
jgi:predicted nucleotidyltransferase component of viral defense system